MITTTRDDLSKMLRNLQQLRGNTRRVMNAMGHAFLSITNDNFNASGAHLRPIPWVNKKDGTPSNLRQSNTLARSNFLKEVTDTTATVTNPMPYANIHQWGGPIGSRDKRVQKITIDGKTTFAGGVGMMPARPFMPVLNGKLTPAAEAIIVAAGQKALDRQLGTGS